MSAHVFLKLLSYRKGINAKLADQFFATNNKGPRMLDSIIGITSFFMH